MAKFRIGQQFKTRGQHPRLCTIRDIHTTFNSDGNLVKLRYVVTHQLMGKDVFDYDVPETTVAMGLLPSFPSDPWDDGVDKLSSELG